MADMSVSTPANQAFAALSEVSLTAPEALTASETNTLRRVLSTDARQILEGWREAARAEVGERRRRLARLQLLQTAAAARPNAMVDPGAPTTARWASRTIPQLAFRSYRPLIIRICAGKECKTGDDDNTRNRLQLIPESRREFVALATLGFATPFWNDAMAFEERVGTLSTAEFALHERDNRTAVTADVLFGVRFCHDLFLGIGPSIYSSESRPLRHWRVAIGGRHPSVSRGLYLLASAGLMWDESPEAPTDAPASGFYPVDRPDSGSAATASVRNKPRVCLHLRRRVGYRHRVPRRARNRTPEEFCRGGRRVSSCRRQLRRSCGTFRSA